MTQDHITANRQYYDERFGPQSQQLNEEEKRRLGMILSQVKTLYAGKSVRIADFGCGRGWLSSQLAANGQVTGFDLSEAAVVNARNNFPQCQFAVLNAEEDIPAMYQGQFDLVVSSEVIEHTNQQQQYIRNASSLLKPGGTLLLTTPNGQWKEQFYTAGREKWQQPLENWLRGQELKMLLPACGLSLSHQTTFNSEWIFDFRPALPAVNILKQPLTRKILKLLSLYPQTIAYLNSRGYGLNILLTAKKI